MKYYCYLGCSILTAEVCSLARKTRAMADFRFIPAGFHEQPGVLRKIIQEEIDRIEELNLLRRKSPSTYKTYDAIILGYGLCSNSVAGLHSQTLPLVIPKAHDCITLLLGSKERYQSYFAKNPATYWYSSGWIERMLPPGPDREARLEQLFSQKNAPENVKFLMESEWQWQKNYNQAVFIKWDLPNNNRYRRYARNCARFLNWRYKVLKGDAGLLEDLITGNWDEQRFLIINPGEEIVASFDEQIMTVKKC